MTVPVWVSIIIAIIAGMFAGIISPLITSRLSRYNWRKQRNFELKYEAFRGACGALAAWYTDALDASLQSQKTTCAGVTRHVEMRPETSQALEQHRGLIAAFFSAEVFEKYQQAARSHVSIENIPNVEFEESKLAFIKAASQELQLDKV